MNWKTQHILGQTFSEPQKYNPTLDYIAISSCSFTNITSFNGPGAFLINLGKKGSISVYNSIFQKCNSFNSHGAFFVSSDSVHCCGTCFDCCKSSVKCHAFTTVTNPTGKCFINETFIHYCTHDLEEHGQAVTTFYSGRNVLSLLNVTSNFCLNGISSFSFVNPSLAFLHFSMIYNNTGLATLAVSFSDKPYEVVSTILDSNNCSSLFSFPIIQATFTGCIFKKNIFKFFCDSGKHKVIVLISCYTDNNIRDYDGVSRFSFCKDKLSVFPSVFVENAFKGKCTMITLSTPKPTPTPMPTRTPRPTATPRPTPKPTAKPTATPLPTRSATPSPSRSPTPSPMPKATPAPTKKVLPEDLDDGEYVVPRKIIPKIVEEDFDIPASKPNREEFEEDQEEENEIDQQNNKADDEENEEQDDDDEDEDEDDEEWSVPQKDPVIKNGRPVLKERDEEDKVPRRLRRREID